jgi:hypothetical protein
MYNVCILPTESIYGLRMIVRTTDYLPKQTDLCNGDAVSLLRSKNRIFNYYYINFKHQPLILITSTSGRSLETSSQSCIPPTPPSEKRSASHFSNGLPFRLLLIRQRFLPPVGNPCSLLSCLDTTSGMNTVYRKMSRQFNPKMVNKITCILIGTPGTNTLNACLQRKHAGL